MPRCTAKSTLPKPRERDVQRAVVQVVKALTGLTLKRQNTGAHRNAQGRLIRYGERGACDLKATLPADGRRLEIEIKAPGRKPTKTQIAYMQSINRDKGCAFWVDDPAQAAHIVRRLLSGWTVTVDDSGDFTITSPDAAQSIKYTR